MCGIFGYYNFKVKRSRKELLECLFTGLRRLEYRGYDSAGIALDAEPCTLSSAASTPETSPYKAPANGYANSLANGLSSPNGVAFTSRVTVVSRSPTVIKSSGVDG